MMVEKLREAREESANVGFQTFTKHIREDKLGLFCFFEGKDSPYYYPRIKSVFTGNYYPINCSGKSNVLKVYELIRFHREYNIYKKCFFVDRDFDVLIQNFEIYETPCYSVENFYTSPFVFGEILKSEFGLSETNTDFIKSNAVYIKLQIEFHEAVLIFNAWYACLIHLKSINKQHTGVNLEDSIPKEFIKISLDSITKNYDTLAIRTKYTDALPVDDEDIRNKVREFETKDKRQVFRGKFELDFMLKILDSLLVDSRTTKTYLSKQVKFHIVHTQAISQFSQYAETPDCLLKYIREVVK
jgi:hypothetical protein